MIHETDTEYQYARVVEYPDGVRRLELNEGLAIHSLYRPGTVLTGGYWDAFLVDPLAVGAAARADRDPRQRGRDDGARVRALLPGHGDRRRRDRRRAAGHRARYFDMRDRPQLRLHTEDARPFLRRTDARFDAIFLDTYRQPYIPFYLTTQGVLRARARPARGRVASVVINVGHPRASDKLEKVLSATLGSVFAHVARDPVKATNTMLIASDAEPSRAALGRAASSLPADLRPIAMEAAGRLEPALRGGDVYTDDHAPVEWLVDASIVQEAAGGEEP